MGTNFLGAPTLEKMGAPLPHTLESKDYDLLRWFLERHLGRIYGNGALVLVGEEAVADGNEAMIAAGNLRQWIALFHLPNLKVPRFDVGITIGPDFIRMSGRMLGEMREILRLGAEALGLQDERDG